MSRPINNLVGLLFNRLTVTGDSGARSAKGEVLWSCQCTCGNETRALAGNLRRGTVGSCGCLARELSSERRRAAKRPPRICSAENCTATVEKGGHGFCGLHAQRVRRHGDPSFITPEDQRRKNLRRAHLARFSEVKPTTYRKLHGRHEHRVVAEAMIGRSLKSDEHVHHKDENKHNNSPENLEVMHWLDHLRLHGRSAKRRA